MTLGFRNKTLIVWMIVLFMISSTSSSCREREQIPGSIKVKVEYGKERNRESYRRDIAHLLEDYLLRSQCFTEVIGESGEDSDLVLDAIIEELSLAKDYGASLGDIVSGQGDPALQTKLTVTFVLKMQVLIRRSGDRNVVYSTWIDVRDYWKKMYPSEDTERAAWESLLRSVEREAEKRICGKQKKIMKGLLNKEDAP